MPIDEFWHGDPELIFVYSEAYQNRINMESWINGMYIYGAISIAIGNAFSKKGERQKKYFSKPFDLKGDSLTEETINIKDRDLVFRNRLMEYY